MNQRTLTSIIRESVSSQLRCRSVKWVRPDLSEEFGEFKRVARGEGLNLSALMRAAAQAELVPLRPSDWRQLENTDSNERMTVKQFRELASRYGRDWRAIEQAICAGSELPAPIILRRADGSATLIAGNTRLMGARALGVTNPRVLEVSP